VKKSILSIAGFDPISGAGVVRDTQIFVEKGLYPLVCITSIVPQTTCKILEVFALSGETVLKELEAIYTEFKPEFVKVGLVPLPELMESILYFLRTKQLSCLIIDPIIKAGIGDPLASNKIKEAILGNPLPNTIIIPNIKEAEFLTGLRIESFEDVKKAAERLENYGFKGVLIKGGHGKGNQIQDVFLYENEFQIFTHPRFPHEIHGTGCTLSSLILSFIALGHSPPEAVEKSIGEIENWIKNGKLIKLSCSYVFQ